MRFFGYTLGDESVPMPPPTDELMAEMGAFMEEATKAGVLVATGGIGPTAMGAKVSLQGSRINVSGCPNSCGQHWIGDIGFFGNARKIEGKEVPYYQMLLGGGYDAEGIMRFGLAVQSIPARLAPEAVTRVLTHFIANREPGESFRNYVVRQRVETFREMTNDLAKPADKFPELYIDWGDDVAFSLQLGRGECAV